MKPTDPIPGFAPNTQINLLGKEVTVVRSQIGGFDEERFCRLCKDDKEGFISKASLAYSCNREKILEVAAWTDGVVKTFKIDGPLLELITGDNPPLHRSQ